MPATTLPPKAAGVHARVIAIGHRQESRLEFDGFIGSAAPPSLKGGKADVSGCQICHQNRKQLEEINSYQFWLYCFSLRIPHAAPKILALHCQIAKQHNSVA